MFRRQIEKRASCSPIISYPILDTTDAMLIEQNCDDYYKLRTPMRNNKAASTQSKGLGLVGGHGNEKLSHRISSNGNAAALFELSYHQRPSLDLLTVPTSNVLFT